MSAPALPTWPIAEPGAKTRLVSLLQARQAMPFVWGLTDCALWAADAVAAVTGHDPASDVRGSYHTALQAVRMIRRRGGLFGLAADRLGLQITASQAWDGDVALLRADVCNRSADGALAVWWRGVLVAQGAAGLVMVPAAAARAHWRAA